MNKADICIKLNETIEILHFLEPHLEADQVEQSSLVRRYLRIILQEIEHEQEIPGFGTTQMRGT